MTNTDHDEMLPEYDFASMEGGVRGKYARAYREGHTVKIHKDNGAVEVRHYTPDAGAVLLDPDVRAYFPDSEAVNNALRTLIELVPRKPLAPHESE